MIVFLLCQLQFSYSISGKLVKFHPFSNNKHNNFRFLSAYWCILLIHLDNVHFGNRLVINAWWQCFLWKICRLSKLDFFLEHVNIYIYICFDYPKLQHHMKLLLSPRNLIYQFKDHIKRRFSIGLYQIIEFTCLWFLSNCKNVIMFSFQP